MNTHSEKIQENKSQSVAGKISQSLSNGGSTFQFMDNRLEAITQRKLIEMANSSSQIMLPRAFQDIPDNRSQTRQVAQLHAAMDDSSSHVLQRKLYPFRDITNNPDMTRVAGFLSEDVDSAKAIVDANPLLTGVDGRAVGYLGTWVTTFQLFLDTGDVPDFFYARYGYAIETLATGFFKARGIAPYTAHDQITYGATRPDFVIQQNGNDVAWLDITSEGSPGHIFNKQGGGWKSKPYVAEVRYKMPSPDNFKVSASGKLTEDQLKKLNAASSARAEQAAHLANGRDTMATHLSNELTQKREEKESGLGKGEVKTIVHNVCKTHLGKYVDKLIPSYSAGVMSSIETLEVKGEVSTGVSWANWAFGNAGNAAVGRVLLAKLGAGI